MAFSVVGELWELDVGQRMKKQGRENSLSALF